MLRYLLRRMKWLAVMFVVFLGAAVLSVFLIYGWPAMGNDALALMTADQKRIASRVLPSIHPTATTKDISKLLGEPMDHGFKRARWAGPVLPGKTWVQAYFIDGRISKITYFSLDPFWSWTLYDIDGELRPAR